MAASIYTRTGDGGQTGLADGSRRPKDDVRIDAIGTVDGLNAAIGVVAAFPESMAERQLLHGIQRNLFDIGAELAAPDSRRLSPDAVSALESAIDRIDAGLPPSGPSSCRAEGLQAPNAMWRAPCAGMPNGRCFASRATKR